MYIQKVYMRKNKLVNDDDFCIRIEDMFLELCYIPAMFHIPLIFRAD